MRICQHLSLYFSTRRYYHCFLAAICGLLLWGWCLPPALGQPVAPPPAAPVLFEFEAEPVPDAAQTSRERGLQAVSEGVYGMAVTFFQEYLRQSQPQEPAFAEATALLAEAYLALNQLTEAEKVLLSHSSQGTVVADLELRARLAYVLSQTYFKLGNWSDCLLHGLPLAGSESPVSFQARAVILCADAAAQMSDWDVSIRVMADYLARSQATSETAMIQQRLVQAYLINGKLDAAKDLLDAIRNYSLPEHEVAFDRLRLLCAALQGDLVVGAAIFQRLSPQCPVLPNVEWWEPMWQFSEALFQAEKYEETVAVLSLAVQVAPDEERKVHALVRLADAYINLNKVNQAKDKLEEIRRNFPDSQELVQVTTRLAQLQQQLGNFLSAAELYAELVLHPKAGQELRYRAWVNQGRSLVRVGEWQQAVQAFLAGEKAGANTWEQSQALFEAAETAADGKELSQAAELYEKVADKYLQTALAPEARMRQGDILMKMARYNDAKAAFARFVEDFSNNPQLETAKLWQGIAMRKGAANQEELLQAVSFLGSLASGSNREDLAVTAYLEAFQAANDAHELELAAEQLSAVINGFPSSERSRDALYQRIVLRFRQNRLDDARQDAESFFASSHQSSSDEADICILMGDSYGAEGHWEKAKEYYLRLATTQEKSVLAPVALYEAAFCSYQMRHLDDTFQTSHLDGALSLLQKMQNLLADMAENQIAPDKKTALSMKEILADYPAKAELLRGDILAEMNELARARQAFAQARTLAGDTELGYAALGRQGEMLLALGDVNPSLLSEAEICFQTILAAEGIPEQLREMATYRMAKCLERRGQHQEALEQYLEIYFAYTAATAENPPRNWIYFCRSVYDAARLLEMRGGTENLRQAARLYEGLAKAGLPVSSDAASRAEGIRSAHRLAQ